MARFFARLVVLSLVSVGGCDAVADDPGDSGDRTASSLAGSTKVQVLFRWARAEDQGGWLEDPDPYIAARVESSGLYGETPHDVYTDHFSLWFQGELLFEDTAEHLLDPRGLTLRMMDDDFGPDDDMGRCFIKLTEADLTAGQREIGPETDECSSAIIGMGISFRVAQADPPAPPTDSDGEVLFKSKCAICHGSDGTADTAMAKSLNVPSFASPDMSHATDEELRAIIADGRGAMKGYGDELTADQITSLVAYIRPLAP